MVCCLYYPATTLGQAEVQLSHVFFEKDTEPYARQRDAEVLRMAEVPITSLLGEVSEVVFFFQHPPCMDSWHVLQEHGVHVVALR